MRRPRLVVMASGGGTTLQNLLDRRCDVAGVVSSAPDAYAVTRATAAGVPVEIIARGPAFGERTFAAVRRFAPDLVVMGGWLKLVPIPPDFHLKVINIHPSLLPAFGGKGMYGRFVHEAVLAAGVKLTGCTAHFVDDQYDNGPILAQTAVPVKDDDTVESLTARVYAAECDTLPAAIDAVYAGGWRVVGRRVVWAA